MSEPTVNCLITHRTDLIIEVPGMPPDVAWSFAALIESDPEIQGQLRALRDAVVRVAKGHLDQAGVGTEAMHVGVHNAGGWRPAITDPTGRLR